jgi:DNA-binding transcriptional ArsR family regulator
VVRAAAQVVAEPVAAHREAFVSATQVAAGAEQALDHAFSALADPTRRRVIELLRRTPLRASDLATACETSRPAMSRHLKILRTSGLVETATERDAASDARERVFQLRPEPFDHLRTWLDEVDRFWTDQLAAFAAHVANAKEHRK